MFLYKWDALFLHCLAFVYIFVQAVYPLAGNAVFFGDYNPAQVSSYLISAARGFCACGMVQCWYLIFVQLGKSCASRPNVIHAQNRAESDGN